MVGEDLVAGRGVDAPLPRRLLRLAGIEADAGGVREEVADGRAVGPGGVVKLECPLLHREEHRVRGEQLGHAGELEDFVLVAERGFRVADEGRRDVVHRPVAEKLLELHAAHFT